MSNFDMFLSKLKDLSSEELQLLSRKIITQLQRNESNENRSAIVSCKKCGDKDCISKYGKDRHGKQRYRCKHCKAVYCTHRLDLFE